MMPSATSARWRPLRSGLINLFKYDNEEFRFEDGRLLLRGNNGAGKSRVLALQLPFLLDGEISSHRVEPDGDPAKRMEWNLLMGGRHENRLGYTWIEFGRVDGDGREQYLTLACGLHARRHGDLKRWFIITPLRIGHDLHLVSDQQVPLTKDRLIAELDGRGQVIERPREYRVAVDEALFGLGRRFEPLIELLIRLRQPQLSRKLDETLLSNALSEALPPLSQSLIEDVAASFRGIEDDREAMHDYRTAMENVAEFLKTYQTYAAIVVRRHAERVRGESSQYEHRAREIKRYSEERDQLLRDLEALKSRLGIAENRLTSHRATERALRDSPEMKSVETLRSAQEKCDDRKRELDQARKHAEQAAADHARCESEMRSAQSAFDISRQNADDALDRLRMTGREADLSLDMDAAPVRKSFEAECHRRNDAIRHLRGQNRALSEAQRRLEDAERELERAAADLESAKETARAAEETLTASVDRFTREALAWEHAARELRLIGDIDWRESAFLWLEDRQSPFPFELAVRECHGRKQTELIGRREALVEQERHREEELRSIDAALRELVDGRQPEPPAPHTRTPDTRLERPGSPFWKLCAFRDEIPAPDRAGYEAALEASGILDAWLCPDGSLVEAATGDVFLTGSSGSPGDGGLNRVLRVESDDLPIPADLVRGILDRIGSEPATGETWVAASGAWSNGALRGVWTKPEAEYLGFAAREKARLRKIETLEGQRNEARARLDELRTEVADLQDRLETLDQERNSAPDAHSIREAAAARDASRRAVADAQPRVTEADRRAGTAREERDGIRTKRDRDAADLGLSAWREPDALDRLDELMAAARQHATAYWYAAQALAGAEATLQAANRRLQEASDRLGDLRTVSTDTHRRFTESSAELDTLKQTLGKTADEVIERLRRTMAEIALAERDLKQLQSDVSTADGDIRVKNEQIRTAEEGRVERQKARDEAIQRFHSLVTSRFIAEARAELQPTDDGWSVSRAVELARRVEQTLRAAESDRDRDGDRDGDRDTDHDDAALSKAQTNLQHQLSVLNDQLGMRGYRPHTEAIGDGVFLVKCPFQGQERAMSSLHNLLGEEVEHRTRMLDEREREVIENHLIGEVAKELQERIRAGETWVTDVNAELERRPTSSGIKLRFAWRVDPDGPTGLAEVNQQLLRLAATWKPAERRAIGDFLQDRIRAERAENENGSWQEHLTRALDYRAWRRFDVERWQDGNWQRLTKRTYGTGSGGEKAMTLTVPQFAAAAAHYRSASDTAPRLILLDEVFVGIDADTRSKLMGLLHTFDLDYVMTSEREWGCYASVPSLAIYQLASRPDIQAVHVTRWVWNGKDRVRA